MNRMNRIIVIRPPCPDSRASSLSYRASRLYLQQPLVLLILCILCIDVNLEKFSMTGADQVPALACPNYAGR